jgi:hypothetical protein
VDPFSPAHLTPALSDAERVTKGDGRSLPEDATLAALGDILARAAGLATVRVK